MDEGALGRQMVDWLHPLDQKWSTLRFDEMKVETDGNLHVFELQVYFNGIDPDAVRVELYAEGVKSSGPVRQEMTRRRNLDGTENGYVLTVPRSQRHELPRTIRRALSYGNRLSAVVGDLFQASEMEVVLLIGAKMA